MTDTIFALATAPGRAALAVLRVSGPDSGAALRALAGPLPEARRASLRKLRTPSGEVFDEALVLWFPAPRSFTGEDQFELHLHGGAATVEGASETLAAMGLRLADPGEFSRRAFEAGRLSLTQAEGIADLVDAQSSAQRRQALAQVGGALDQRHAGWRAALIELLARLNAEVDFPDEDLPRTVARVEQGLATLLAALEAELQDSRGERVRSGFRIALIGRPNAGKSSLLNALVGRDAAIVTDIAGTTRDVIEVPLELAGYRVLLADTAGLREAAGIIEAEGVRRARAWAAEADLRVLVIDSADQADSDGLEGNETRSGDVIVFSKSDLHPALRAETLTPIPPGLGLVEVSVVTGEGLDSLRARLKDSVVSALGGGEFPAVTQARHRRHLDDAVAALRAARDSLQRGPELAAEDVRRAATELKAIAGEVGVEAVLDRVFASFCIGK